MTAASLTVSAHPLAFAGASTQTCKVSTQGCPGPERRRHKPSLRRVSVLPEAADHNHPGARDIWSELMRESSATIASPRNFGYQYPESVQHAGARMAAPFSPRSSCGICATPWRPPSTEASARRGALEVKESTISWSVRDLEDESGVSGFIRVHSRVEKSEIGAYRGEKSSAHDETQRLEIAKIMSKNQSFIFSVAPMMDWTSQSYKIIFFNNLNLRSKLMMYPMLY